MSAQKLLAAVSEATHVLVKYDDNWADEFDVEGYRVFTRSEFEHFVDMVSNHSFDGVRHGFGTNEEIEYFDVESYLNTLTATAISAADFDTFVRLFKDHKCCFWFEPEAE